jgi:hypothetical protein
MKRPARAPSQVSESLHKRLSAYALAASAAGVGMLALAPPAAEARIVYTKTHVVLGDLYDLDLNNDRITDFVFSTHGSKTKSSRGFETLSISPLRRNGVAGKRSGSASALPFGKVIGPKLKFRGYLITKISGHCTHTTRGGSSCHTNTLGGQFGTGYLGLKFFIHGKAHYGWARLTVAVSGFINATLTGYAYESIPNKPIAAGRRKGQEGVEGPQEPAVPQPLALGHLAAGASTIPAWRLDGTH